MMNALDHTVFQRLYGGHGLWLWFMAALTVIGNGTTVIPIALLAAFRRLRPKALKLVGVLGVVAIVVFVIKVIVGRVRPWEAIPDVHALVFSGPTDSSFPSGHAAGSFAVATFVALETRAHIAIKIGLFAIAAAIGVSRVTLGVHFPGDVIVGALIGTMLSLIASRVELSRNARATKRIM